MKARLLVQEIRGSDDFFSFGGAYRLVPPKKRIFQKCFPICWLYGFTTAIAQNNRYS
jgi:hypothetical protein